MSDRPACSPTELAILRGTLKLALVTLAAAEQARSARAVQMLVADAAAGLRIGLQLAKENADGTSHRSNSGCARRGR